MSLLIEAFRPKYRSSLIELWNQCFRHHRNFMELTRSIWKKRFEDIPSFCESTLLVAVFDGKMVGFVHGGHWEKELLEQTLENLNPNGLAYLSMIAVAQNHRRQGVGKKLIAHLLQSTSIKARQKAATENRDWSDRHALSLVVDGKVLNPFYGNIQAPIPPLWGTTEGVMVPEEDVAAVSFLKSCRFSCQQSAISLLARIPKELHFPWKENAKWECLMEGNYIALLGGSSGQSFALENQSISWVAVKVDSAVQMGQLIGYPLSNNSWALYELNVAASARGQGVAKMLLSKFFEYLNEQGISTVECLVLPEESPGAYKLYSSFGFREEARWSLFE